MTVDDGEGCRQGTQAMKVKVDEDAATSIQKLPIDIC